MINNSFLSVLYLSHIGRQRPELHLSCGWLKGMRVEAYRGQKRLLLIGNRSLSIFSYDQTFLFTTKEKEKSLSVPCFFCCVLSSPWSFYFYPNPSHAWAISCVLLFHCSASFQSVGFLLCSFSLPNTEKVRRGTSNEISSVDLGLWIRH